MYVDPATPSPAAGKRHRPGKLLDSFAYARDPVSGRDIIEARPVILY